MSFTRSRLFPTASIRIKATAVTLVACYQYKLPSKSVGKILTNTYQSNTRSCLAFYAKLKMAMTRVQECVRTLVREQPVTSSHIINQSLQTHYVQGHCLGYPVRDTRAFVRTKQQFLQQVFRQFRYKTFAQNDNLQAYAGCRTQSLNPAGARRMSYDFSSWIRSSAGRFVHTTRISEWQ